MSMRGRVGTAGRMAMVLGGVAGFVGMVGVAQAQQPVGTAPEGDSRPPAVAPLFEQPGVLTARGKIDKTLLLQWARDSVEGQQLALQAGGRP